MSEYLERQIYERLLKSEPSIVKLIENMRISGPGQTDSQAQVAQALWLPST